jgi:hypothetical protein
MGDSPLEKIQTSSLSAKTVFVFYERVLVVSELGLRLCQRGSSENDANTECREPPLVHNLFSRRATRHHSRCGGKRVVAAGSMAIVFKVLGRFDQFIPSFLPSFSR